METFINLQNQKELVVKKSMKQLSLLKFMTRNIEEIDYRKELKTLVKELKLFYYKLVETYKVSQTPELLIIIRELEDIIESYSYL